MLIPEVIENLDEFRATDREECGVLIAKGERYKSAKIIRCQNVAVSDGDYAVSMDDYLRVQGMVEGTKYRAIGFFHTHLAKHHPSPSKMDVEGASIFPEFINCVYHPASGKTAWYGTNL